MTRGIEDVQKIGLYRPLPLGARAMINDDEYLERIVAGIQSVTTRDADVTWNEIINGRQFDVVVRFKIGTLRYLVLVEVRNRTRKASTSDMDAFVSKARDQNANKAVFVTAAGFQSGAITVAKRHAIDLFTVTFDASEINLPANAGYVTLRRTGAPLVPPELSLGDPRLIAQIERGALVYESGKEYGLPNEASQMNYYVRKTKLTDGRTLHDLIQAAPFVDKVDLDRSVTETLTLDPPQAIDPPDTFFFPPGVITGIKCEITGRNGRPIRGNTGIESTLFTMPVLYTNVLTGESDRFALESLPLGVKRVLLRFDKGRFGVLVSGREFPDGRPYPGCNNPEHQVFLLLHSRHGQENHRPAANSSGKDEGEG